MDQDINNEMNMQEAYTSIEDGLRLILKAVQQLKIVSASDVSKSMSIIEKTRKEAIKHEQEMSVSVKNNLAFNDINVSKESQTQADAVAQLKL